MKSTSMFLLFSTFLIAGCAEFAANFRDYEEPEKGETAKIRFNNASGNMFLVPDRSCLDWSAPGAGLVASKDSGRSSIHNNKSLGMIGQPIYNNGASEVLVSAEKPLTIIFKYERLTLAYMKTTCDVAVTFLPKSGQQYDAPGRLGLGYCFIQIDSLTIPSQRVSSYKADSC